MKGKNTLPDQTHHCDADGPMGEARERRAGLGWNSERPAADSFVEAVPNPFVEKLQARINDQSRHRKPLGIQPSAGFSPERALAAYTARSLAAARLRAAGPRECADHARQPSDLAQDGKRWRVVFLRHNAALGK